MNPNTENSEFCEQFVNNLGMIMLVEAGLDWNPLEAQSAHNQRQAKDFSSFSGFYLGGRTESCTAHHLSSVHFDRRALLLPFCGVEFLLCPELCP